MENLGTERDLRLCRAHVGSVLGFLFPGVCTYSPNLPCLPWKAPSTLASQCPPLPGTQYPMARMRSPHQPACRMGPLSVLPPKPNLSQKGGAQWASQWQFFLLLHTFQRSRGEGTRGKQS